MSDDTPAPAPAPVSPTPVPLAPGTVATGTPLATRADQLPVLPTEERAGAVLPSFPPQPAAKMGTNSATSPSGPGTPIDGSISVNTYTPEETQKAEFEAGVQDWQSAVATKVPVVMTPQVTPEDGADDRADRKE